jgi:hypothetical protein
MRTLAIVDTPEEGDVLSWRPIANSNVRRYSCVVIDSVNTSLAAAMTASPQIENHSNRNQTCFDRLSETDFVSEDITTFAKATQSKDYRVDLVRIRIDTRLPLRRGVPLQIVWSTDTDEILS